MYLLANDEGNPLLVKFSDQVSYLPVFESKQEAAFAAESLRATYAAAIQKTGQTYQPQPFTWAIFQKSREGAKQFGHMLFVYPMSPHEYGRSFQTHAE